jgi:hypothetical protein
VVLAILVGHLPELEEVTGVTGVLLLLQLQPEEVLAARAVTLVRVDKWGAIRKIPAVTALLVLAAVAALGVGQRI